MTQRETHQDRPSVWQAANALTAQYDRLLQSPNGGTYCFTLEADDRATVLVNGDLLIDMTGTNQTSGQSKHLALAPGNHHIQLRYQDRNGEACLRFSVDQTLARGTLPDSLAMPETHLMEIQQSGSKATVL